MFGYCGAEGQETSVWWELTENAEKEDGEATYTLTISGKGKTCNSFDDVKATVGGEKKSVMNAYGEKIIKIVVDEGVTYLGANLTRNTKNVEIEIPASVTEMYFVAEGTTDSASTLGNTYRVLNSDNTQTVYDIAEITVDENNPNFKMENGVLFSKDGKTLYRYTAKAAANYTVPSTVTAIAAKAFARSAELASLTIPEGVTYIGADCFDKSNNLSGTIVIPASVKTLGSACFTQLPNLTGVEFKATDLSDYHAMRSNNGAPSTGIQTITFAGGTTVIPKALCKKLDLLETVNVPESLITIEDEAFSGCKSLKTITLTENTKLTAINAGAFSNTQLTEIVIPDTVTEIGGSAFDGCSKLTKVTISPNSQLSKIGGSAFAGIAVTSLYLPKGVTYWGTYAFGGTRLLKAVDLTTVTSVDNCGSSAFYNTDHGADISDTYVNRVYYMAKSDVALKTALGSNSGKSIYAITNGGTFTTLPDSNNELATPEKAGYKFLGWYMQDGSNDNWGDEVQTLATGKTYYAKWQELGSTFTLAADGETSVTYDPNGGVTLTVAASNADLPLTGCTYEWYKDGEKLTNTDASLKLTDVAASGEYQVKITNADEKWTALTDEVTVTITKATQDISYATKSVSKRIGAANFTNKLTETTVFGDITYESSNESVAKVDAATGEVTIVGVGTAVITARAADGGENYGEASDSYTLTVSRRVSAPSAATPEPEPDDGLPFTDVPKSAYFYDAVEWAVGKEITDGMSATMFGPYESCTRAQIVTFLWRAAGSPEPKAASSFSDVPASAYYAKAVAWAVENGITNGMTETTFAPNATCTRGQSVTFLYRALGKKVESSANFTDVKSDAFYADAVNWAVANNVTNGTSATTFSPNADCTRAEIVTFLYRAYQGK